MSWCCQKIAWPEHMKSNYISKEEALIARLVKCAVDCQDHCKNINDCAFVAGETYLKKQEANRKALGEISEAIEKFEPKFLP